MGSVQAFLVGSGSGLANAMGLENPLHTAMILLVLLLMFGAKKLPEMGRGLGDGMREFHDSMSGQAQHQPARRSPRRRIVATPAIDPATAPPARWRLGLGWASPYVRRSLP